MKSHFTMSDCHIIRCVPALLSSHHPSVSCCRMSQNVDVKMIWGKKNAPWGLDVADMLSSPYVSAHQLFYSSVSLICSTALIAFHKWVQSCRCFWSSTVDCNKLLTWDHLLDTRFSTARTFFSQWHIPLHGYVSDALSQQWSSDMVKPQTSCKKMLPVHSVNHFWITMSRADFLKFFS